MRWYLVILFAYALTVIQTALFDTDLLALSMFGVRVRPDLLLVMALYVALVAEPGEVFIAAWCLGLVEDLTLSGGPLGVSAVLFGVAAWLVSLLRPALVTTRILTQVLLAFAAVLVIRLPQQAVLRLLTGIGQDWGFVLTRSLGDALYSALLAPYLLWLLTQTVGRPNPMRR